MPASSLGRAVTRLLREPLVHFVLGGATLFAVTQALAPASVSALPPDRIVGSTADLNRIVSAWTAQSGTPPPPRIMEALVAQDLREEILAREAVALGLDKGDPIVRRRLAQRMNFLAADIATLQEPSDATLRDWYAVNSARFAELPRVSFRHLYFSFDRDQSARDDAAAALRHLRQTPVDTASADADPFMFRDTYAERTSEQIGREFGAGFAGAVLTLAPGGWRGPVRSGYGWHLVRVDGIELGRIPRFEEIAPDVRSACLEEMQRKLLDNAYAAMLARYEIVTRMTRPRPRCGYRRRGRGSDDPALQRLGASPAGRDGDRAACRRGTRESSPPTCRSRRRRADAIASCGGRRSFRGRRCRWRFACQMAFAT